MRRGVDFDGTLATYEEWEGVDVLGEPIPDMVARVKRWLAQGDEVAIVTARAYPPGSEDAGIATKAIQKWCLGVIGTELEVTCMKDWKMEEIWDDRAVRVDANTGTVSSQSEIIDRELTAGDTDGIGEFLKS